MGKKKKAEKVEETVVDDVVVDTDVDETVDDDNVVVELDDGEENAAPNSNKTPVETDVEAAEKIEKPAFEIAEGCSLCCNRKNLSEGMEIKAEWVPGGAKRLDELVKAGKVVKN